MVGCPWHLCRNGLSELFEPACSNSVRTLLHFFLLILSPLYGLRLVLFFCVPGMHLPLCMLYRREHVFYPGFGLDAVVNYVLERARPSARIFLFGELCSALVGQGFTLPAHYSVRTLVVMRDSLPSCWCGLNSWHSGLRFVAVSSASHVEVQRGLPLR